MRTRKQPPGVPITLNGQPATLGFMSTEYAAGVIANLQAENKRLRDALEELGYEENRRERCPGCGYDIVDCEKRSPVDCTGRAARRALEKAP